MTKWRTTQKTPMRLRVAVVVSVLFTSVAVVNAQTDRGELRLMVTDATGLPLRASGTLTSEAPQLSRTFMTSDEGAFSLDALPFGIYRLVVEGSGYDLHWDMKFECLDAFKWEWAEVPKKFEWKQGDYIYIPPFTTHQHFATAEARLIMMSNRMVKEMGFDWFDQVEPAPGFEPAQK